MLVKNWKEVNQNETSIEAQEIECKKFCERNGYNIVGKYKDEAVSAKTDNREEFQKMIADSSKKLFEGIVVYQLDRFARNRYDSANYKQKLKKNGVRVLSAKENISDDASGILMESMLERNGLILQRRIRSKSGKKYAIKCFKRLF